MQSSHFVGWDIGGAHLKVASLDHNGKLTLIKQFATPLWQGLEMLTEAFPRALADIPQDNAIHAITMTAELADIFPNRQAGVDCLINICAAQLGKKIQFYSSQQGLLELDQARTNSLSIASANWHGTTAYVCTKIASGLLIDVGSTTTDIIPFHDQQLQNRGNDDHDRLQFDELIYTGVLRTALMSLTRHAPFNGQWQSLAAEHFATTADIYRLLNKLKQDDDLTDSADGKLKDASHSISRLARVLGTDADRFGTQQWIRLAQYFAETQCQLLTHAVLRVLSFSNDHGTIIGAGTGCFLVKEIATRLNLTYCEFSELLETPPSLQHSCNRCASAVALAQLNRLANAT